MHLERRCEASRAAAKLRHIRWHPKSTLRAATTPPPLHMDLLQSSLARDLPVDRIRCTIGSVRRNS